VNGPAILEGSAVPVAVYHVIVPVEIAFRVTVFPIWVTRAIFAMARLGCGFTVTTTGSTSEEQEVFALCAWM
jgi:spore germination cell wall hydrolase CwlJ-like protein